MTYLNYCNHRDVAFRLFSKKRHWFHGIPKVALKGNSGSFGHLVFDFGDEIVSMKIYIKDKEPILDAAFYAVMKFSEIINNMSEEEKPPLDTSRGSQAWL